MQRIYLLRSPEELIYRERAGYGWNPINFSEFSGQSDDQLMLAFAKLNLDIGRQQNQILRFFNIKPGDLIVVPVQGGIVLGEAGEHRFYEKDVDYGGNQLSVSYFKDKNKDIIRISRTELKEALQARLKIRMTIVGLSEFSEDIEQLIKQIKQGGAIGISQTFIDAEDKAGCYFRNKLLDNIRSGQTGLQSGGLGLEHLVKELMTLEGYEAAVLDKNNSEGIGDIDVKATKTDRLYHPITWRIQVKHHTGLSDRHGIEQLLALPPEENTYQCFITTAELDKVTKDLAETHGIKVVEGLDLVTWIHERWALLTPATKIRLGAIDVPQLILNT
jgi:restriction system protein